MPACHLYHIKNRIILNFTLTSQVRGNRHEHLPVGAVSVRDHGPAQRVRLHPQAPRAPHGGEAAEDLALGDGSARTTPHGIA